MKLLWYQVICISKLEEIFTMFPKKSFAFLSVMTVDDFLQLPPVKGKLAFSRFLIKIV